MSQDEDSNQDSASLITLRNAFEQLLPLADDLADALGVLLLLSGSVILWIFYNLFQLHDIGIGWALIASVIAIIPVLILGRFWYALNSLQDIPDVAVELIDDVTEDISQSWHAARAGKKSALNFFGQAKKLLQIRTLIESAGDIMKHYFNIAPIINPFYLFLALTSFASLFLIFLTGLVLAFMSIF